MADLTTSADVDSLMAAANAAAMRTVLGLGTMATQAASAVAVTGGTLAGVKLSSLTSNGIVTTSGGDGTLSVTGTSTGGNGVADSGKVPVFNSVGGLTIGKSDIVSTPLVVYSNAAVSPSMVVHQYGAGGYIIGAVSHANSLGGYSFFGGGINENALEAVFLATAQGCVGVAVDFSLTGGHSTARGVDLYMEGLGKALVIDDSVWWIDALGGMNYVTVNPAANATAITVSTATHTASAPAFSAVQTWNNGAVTFEALKLNVTNTASAAASTLLDLQVGGSSKFKVGYLGTVTVADTTASTNASTGCVMLSGGLGIQGAFHGNSDFVLDSTWGITAATGNQTMYTTGLFGWPASGGYGTAHDISLSRVSAGIMKVTNGANPTSIRVHGDATKYAHLGHDGTNAILNSSSGNLHISSLPTANPGAGILWNNAGTPAIGT